MATFQNGSDIGDNITDPTLKQDSIKSYKSTGANFEVNSPLRYPLVDQSDHFVRFFINLDEESRMFTEQKLQVLGNVDQTDQARLRKQPIDQGLANTAAAVGVGIWAATKGAQISANNLKGFKGNSMIKTGILLTDTAIAGAAGAAVGYLASSQLKIDKKLKRLSTTITLYTPSNITSSLQTSWDNYSDLMMDLLQAGSDPDTLKSISSGSLANTDVHNGEKAKHALSTIGRAIATESSNLIKSATRTAVNPKQDLLFKSIGRRDFSFDYQFAPKTSEEAKEVASIIKAFRLFASPEVIKGTNEFLYTYPAEFDIEYGFIKDDIENQNKYLNKISSCVLTNITINYAPNGSFNTLEDGEPVFVSMGLHFQELETMHRDRIAAGY